MHIRKNFNPRTAMVFTTTQISQICCVATRTVANWCDAGKLRCYRVPGSVHRRISREQFERFLREHEMECFLPSISPLPAVSCPEAAT